MTAAYLAFFGLGRLPSQLLNPQPVSWESYYIGLGTKTGLEITFSANLFDQLPSYGDDWIITLDGVEQPLAGIYHNNGSNVMRVYFTHVAEDGDVISVRLTRPEPMYATSDGSILTGFQEIEDTYLIAKSLEFDKDGNPIDKSSP